MKKIGVVQTIDTLEIGGAERVAVNIANHLPSDRYQSSICTTRRDGPLAASLSDDVRRLSLHRKSRFDLQAIRRLVEFNRQHNVRILHAHSSAVFVSAAASCFAPFPAVVWHVHYGGLAADGRVSQLYRLIGRRIRAVIAVNEGLAHWARRSFPALQENIWYVPNPVTQTKTLTETAELPDGIRIACVANLRKEKDLLTLVRAMRTVVDQMPEAKLLAIGGTHDPSYSRLVHGEAEALGLKNNIFWMGPRKDVAGILSQCHAGVLSSVTEGLPMALLEYGLAGLPVVCTDVGQCAEVLDFGRAGVLVPAGNVDTLAHALIRMVGSKSVRMQYGARLRSRVEERHGTGNVMKRIGRIYESITGSFLLGSADPRELASPHRD